MLAGITVTTLQKVRAGAFQRKHAIPISPSTNRVECKWQSWPSIITDRESELANRWMVDLPSFVTQTLSPHLQPQLLLTTLDESHTSTARKRLRNIERAFYLASACGTAKGEKPGLPDGGGLHVMHSVCSGQAHNRAAKGNCDGFDARLLEKTQVGTNAFGGLEECPSGSGGGRCCLHAWCDMKFGRTSTAVKSTGAPAELHACKTTLAASDPYQSCRLRVVA